MRRLRPQDSIGHNTDEKLCSGLQIVSRVTPAFITEDEQMKFAAWWLIGCTMQVAADAAAFDEVRTYGGIKTSSADRATLSRNMLASRRDHLFFGDTRQADRSTGSKGISEQASPLALAIESAAKKGVIAVGVEAYTDVLIQCQRKQSPAATTALMRSDSQQAHCFRF